MKPAKSSWAAWAHWAWSINIGFLSCPTTNKPAWAAWAEPIKLALLILLGPTPAQPCPTCLRGTRAAKMPINTGCAQPAQPAQPNNDGLYFGEGI